MRFWRERHIEATAMSNAAMKASGTRCGLANGVALRVRRALFVVYVTLNIAFRLLIAEPNVIGLLTHGYWADRHRSSAVRHSTSTQWTRHVGRRWQKAGISRPPKTLAERGKRMEGVRW